MIGWGFRHSSMEPPRGLEEATEAAHEADDGTEEWDPSLDAIWEGEMGHEHPFSF